MNPAQRFQDRVVVVTGGASGIGRAAAIAYAREGGQVAIGDIDEAGGRSVVQAIDAAGGKAIFVRTDVVEALQVETLVEAAVARFGKLDAIFASAGVYPAEDAGIIDVDPAVFFRLIDVNLKGMFHAAKYALPHLVGTGGAVVLTSAQAAMTGAATTGFAASAGGVIAFMRSVAYQYGPLGVRANAIVPASIDTPMVQAIRTAHGLPLQMRGETTLLGRPGAAEDAAQLALFLSSDDASYVTGAAMTVDGGRL